MDVTADFKLDGIKTDKGLIVFMDLGEKWQTNHYVVTAFVYHNLEKDTYYVRFEDYEFDWSKYMGLMYYNNSGSGPARPLDIPKGSTYWVCDSLAHLVVEGGRPGHKVSMLKEGVEITSPSRRLNRRQVNKLIGMPVSQIFHNTEETYTSLAWCSQCQSRIPVSNEIYPCPHLEWCDSCSDWTENCEHTEEEKELYG